MFMLGMYEIPYSKLDNVWKLLELAECWSCIFTHFVGSVYTVVLPQVEFWYVTLVGIYMFCTYLYLLIHALEMVLLTLYLQTFMIILYSS